MFHTGRPAISDLFTNAITGRQTYTVEVPVLREGRVVYDFGLDPTPASLADLISRQHLEEGWVASIIDARGIVVARHPNAEVFVGQSTSASLLALLMNRLEGVAETDSLDGAPLLTAYTRSDPSGWRVAVGVPRSLVYAPLRPRVFTILGIGALVLLLSLASAAGLARRITVPIAGLARFASEAAQRRGPLTPAQTGLSEVDEVGQILATTTRSLRELANTLMAGLELLLDAVQGQERPTRYAQMALASSEKGAELTHSLLSFSRQQMLRPEAVDTPALLERLKNLLSRTIDPRIVFGPLWQPGSPRRWLIWPSSSLCCSTCA